MASAAEERARYQAAQAMQKALRERAIAEARARLRRPPGGVSGGTWVEIFSNKPRIAVRAKLMRPVAPPVPKPLVSTVERPGRASLTQWNGRAPFEMVLPIWFDNFASRQSVEREIQKLEQLALLHAGDSEPPAVRFAGPVPLPTGMKSPPTWRIAEFEEIPERTQFNNDGHRIRWAVNVHVVERVVDKVLTSSIKQTIDPVGTGSGKTTVKKGETSFHDVAERVYRDRSKAKEIAKKNGMRLSKHLTVGMTIKLP